VRDTNGQALRAHASGSMPAGMKMPRANITQNQSESITISPVHELIDRPRGDQDSCIHPQGSRDQATNHERSADMSPASPA
jgi:hypothetical protein